MKKKLNPWSGFKFFEKKHICVLYIKKTFLGLSLYLIKIQRKMTSYKSYGEINNFKIRNICVVRVNSRIWAVS